MNNKEILYHFVGIKGSGMSSLALVLHEKATMYKALTLKNIFSRNVI